MQEDVISIKPKNLIIGIFLSLLLPLLALYSPIIFKNYKFNYEIIFYISRVNIWLAVFVLFLFTLKIEKFPFLIWKETPYPILFIIKSIIKTILQMFLAVYIIGLLVLIFKLKTESVVLNKALAVFHNHFFLLFFTCITAGITEELIFRGYLLPRLEILLKNTKLAIILSSLFFGLLHYSYGTLINVLGPIAFGFIFAIHYKKYRNIKILIFCHFLWDFIILLIKS